MEYPYSEEDLKLFDKGSGYSYKFVCDVNVNLSMPDFLSNQTHLGY